VDVQEISPKDIQRLFPLCRVDDVYSGFYVESDGRVNPVDACMALAKGARMYGAKLFEGVRVTGVSAVPDRNRMNRVVSGVSCIAADGSPHFIQADVVVNCAGMWARQLGELSGVTIPNQAAEHYYLITDSMPEVDPNWPVSSFVVLRAVNLWWKLN
jgi:4-methylaminobutanoate oxidase (formaldehyde-forming)